MSSVQGPLLRVRTGVSYFTPFVVNLGQRNAVFVERNVAPLLARLHWRLARHVPDTLDWMARNACAVLPERDFDVIHLVNAVPLLPKRPYLVTFEDFMPRLPDDRYVGSLHAFLRRQVLGPRCVALVAMSEYARRQFRWQNRGYPELDRLERKMHRIYPAVPLRRSEPKKSSGRLSLLFVGRQFMRKGGPALLRAHERLRQRGVPVQTTIVSALDWSADDYIGPPSAAYVQRELERLRLDGVVHVRGAPNAETLTRMEQADYFVNPTLHDTFGFAPVEAMSCGTPVIATDTCAQSEIVEDGRSGYLLPFENEEHVGKWTWAYRNREAGYVDAYDRAIQSVSEALVERLTRCWETRSDYEALSAGALAHVRARFDRTQARDRLEQLYEDCRGAMAP